MAAGTAEKGGLRKYIIIKSGRNFLLSGLNLALGLALLPTITKAVGQTGYGIFALLMTFSAQVNLVEFGFGAYITKKVSEWKSGGPAADEFLSTSAYYMGMVALATTATVALVLFLFFDRLFKVPPEIAAHLFLPKLLTVGLFLSVFVTMFYSRILAGCHAFEFIRFTTIGTEVARFSWIILAVGPQSRLVQNIVLLVGVRLATNVVMAFVLRAGCRKYLPTPFTFRLSAINPALRKSMFVFSAPLIASKLLNRSQSLGGVFIIGASLGPAGAGILLLAQRFYITLGEFASNLIMTVFPMASRINSQEKEKILPLYMNATYYNLTLNSILAACLAVLIAPTMRLFFPAEFAGVSPIIWAYLPSLIFGSLYSVGNEIILGMARYLSLTKHLVAMTVVSLAAQFVLTRWLGPIGIALGVTTASLYFLLSSWLVHRRILQAPIRKMLVQNLRQLVPLAVMLACGFILFPVQQAANWISLAGWFSLTSAAGFIAVYIVTIQPQEKRMLRGMLSVLPGFGPAQ